MLLVDPDDAPSGVGRWCPRLLDGPAGLPLGVDERARYQESSADLGAGTWLLGYTDGFVERRGEAIDAGLDRLVDAVEASSQPDLDAILDELLAAVPAATGDDDIALIALRIDRAPTPRMARLLPEPRRGGADGSP
jgi:hypothetical protein